MLKTSIWRENERSESARELGHNQIIAVILLSKC